MSCDKWVEQAELYALGALEISESAPFEAHLGRCRSCEEHVQKTRAALALLPASLAPVAPPAHLKAAVMERIAPENAPAPAAAAPSFSWAWLVTGAVALAFAGITAVLNTELATLNTRVRELQGYAAAMSADADQKAKILEWLHNPDVKLVRMEGAIGGKPVKGTLLWNPAVCNGLFLGQGMERVPEGKAYEFWLIEKGKPLAAGMFQTDADGTCTFRLPEVQMGHYDQFAITLEARQGAAQPTGSILLSGALPSPLPA